MNYHHVSGSVTDRSLSLCYRLIYRVDNGKVVRSSRFNLPNLNVRYRRACRYVHTDSINIQILQALCKVLVNGCGSFLNGFLRVAPRIVGLRKCLDEILYLVGINNTLLNDFFLMYRVHINGGEILIHPKADTGNQHQP